MTHQSQTPKAVAPNLLAPRLATEQGVLPLLQNFQSEMNRLFDRFNGTDQPMIAAIDVAETDNDIEVKVDVPGIDQKDLDVSLLHENLIIQGTKSQEREDEAKNWHFTERSFGSFRRVVPLGFSPTDDKVDAQYANGVLTLRVKKPEGATTNNRKIEIKAG